MKKPFKSKKLPKDVQKEYSDCLISDDWVELLEYLEENYTFSSINDINFLVFYAYVEISCALTVYVDDVLETLQKVKKELIRFENEPIVKDFFEEIKKIENTEKRRIKKIKNFIKQDFSQLQLSDKKDVAYYLADSKSIDHICKAAEMFNLIFLETQNLYYYANYATLLYKSGQKDHAIQEYAKILKFGNSIGLENHTTFIDTIYSDLLDYNANNKNKFRETWDEAISNEFIKAIPSVWQYTNFEFPISEDKCLKILKQAYDYEFFDICIDLKNKIERRKIKVTSDVKNIIDSIQIGREKGEF